MDFLRLIEHVSTHLMAQGRRSTLDDENGFSCAYRGVDGAKCAVGCLIPDDLYIPALENQNVYGLQERADFWAMFVDHLEAQFPSAERSAQSDIWRVLSKLQRIHDSRHPDVWGECRQYPQLIAANESRTSSLVRSSQSINQGDTP